MRGCRHRLEPHVAVFEAEVPSSARRRRLEAQAVVFKAMASVSSWGLQFQARGCRL
jgi:hypothetical protein